jgi:hypothetical protein
MLTNRGRRKMLKYSTVQYSTVQYSTVQYSTAQHKLTVLSFACLVTIKNICTITRQSRR